MDPMAVDVKMMHQCIKVTGCIQGVGFRPFVYKLAKSLHLKGRVQNQSDGVFIEILGNSAALDIFHQKLKQEHPIHARIDAVSFQVPPTLGDKLFTDFQILNSVKNESTEQKRSTEIPADLRVCQGCITELFEPTDRRYLYPFINCTQCGPRFSIINSLPYDRHHTSMSSFQMCLNCLHEYQSPDQRRFHAQPIACEHCGPTLSLFQSNGKKISTSKTIQETARLIKAGKIIAIKGIGGFHLMCDAGNSEAVKTLRQRKHRPDKPFAVMALNTASIEHLVELNQTNKAQLRHVAAPIVLLPKQSGCDERLINIATDMSDLGCILPYTPIHYLLFHALLGEPDNHDWMNQAQTPILVVTSANLSGEPLITTNENCMEKLADIADYFLCHDRKIVAGCDDSVMQVNNESVAIIRRARGYTPQSITLPQAGLSVLACGAYLKNTFCITQDDKAYLSTYMGELNNVESRLNYLETIKQTLHKLNIQPDIVACDLHPDFYSTHVAEQYSQNLNIPLVQVQHHHAHIAAVIAEQSISGPVLGLALDGIGLGEDNQFWGGELFFGEACHLKRIGHLSTLQLPSGDQTNTEIWRIAIGLIGNINNDDIHTTPLLSHLYEQLSHYKSNEKIPLSTQQIAFIQDNLTVKTSSTGRWFDAISALLNIRSKVTFEGQAAMHLEYFAQLHGTLPKAKHLAIVKPDGVLDLYPIIALLLSQNDLKLAAAHFHSELIDGLIRWISWAAVQYPSKKVVCSGGCFQNKIIRYTLQKRLEIIGYEVYFPQQHPANDGGISLGQAWIASQQLNKGF